MSDEETMTDGEMDENVHKAFVRGYEAGEAWARQASADDVRSLDEATREAVGLNMNPIHYAPVRKLLREAGASAIEFEVGDLADKFEVGFVSFVNADYWMGIDE